jgi:LacI family transcriptional regulator
LPGARIGNQQAVKKNPTIKDIAKAVGVSPAAVSLALNDGPRISQATRERIAEVAAKLHYRPNYVARSLVGSRSNTLGLVITTILNPFYPELAKGIEDKAVGLGYSIMLCSTNYDSRQQRYVVETLRSKGVDGIIFSSVESDDANIVSLLEDGFPFVLVNRKTLKPSLESKIDYVVMDNVAGGFLVVQHLYRLGHRRIGIITGSLTTSTAVQRTKGAKQALLACGLAVDPHLIVECGFSKEKAHTATCRLLSLAKRPTAIFAENDYMAFGVREAILDAGLRIPDDVALVGFDDIEASGLPGVELSTVTQKKYEMGGLAAQILIERIEGKTHSPQQVVLQPELVVRASCGFCNHPYKTTRPNQLRIDEHVSHRRSEAEPVR